jgi:hypothetical protein
MTTGPNAPAPPPPGPPGPTGPGREHTPGVFGEQRVLIRRRERNTGLVRTAPSGGVLTGHRPPNRPF